jgi:hypothetical protein
MLFFKTPQGETSCYGMDTDKVIAKEPTFIEPEMTVELIAPQDFESGELSELSLIHI